MLISTASQFLRFDRLRRRAATVAALAVVLVLIGAMTAVAAPSGTGSISGRVVDGNGNPVEGICVNVEAGQVFTTDSAGAYTLSGLDTGSYKVSFRDCSPTPVYVTQWYSGQADVSSANVVPVTDGVDVPIGDVTLVRGASVSGIVTDSNGAPLASICVDANVFENNSYNWIAGAVSGPDGSYTIGSLPATDVRIHFRDCSGSNFLDQWYEQQSNANDAMPLSLSPGESRTGINAQIARGISVSGRVTDANGNPIAGINVNLNPTENGSSAWGQTDSSGRYTSSGLPPGTYRVQFTDSGSNPTWASQYWSGKSSRNLSNILTLTDGDGPVRGGVNAKLAAAASITGTVTAPDGAPAGNVCVIALVDTPDGPDWLASVNTASDGTYALVGLPPIAVAVYFQDCNGVGPYVDHFWRNSSSIEGATLLHLQAGVRRSGVNTQFAQASRITGRVTDLAGHPLENICAQASTDTFFGGMGRSQSDGRYAITLTRPGAYKVQFVDCNDSPQYAGEWWDDQPLAANARTASVAVGQTVGHVDAALAPGAVGSISGRVVNVNGIAMTTACVVAFIPNQYAKFASVGSDGSYTIPDLPSGTYSIAFLGCEEGEEPGAIVTDPQSSITTYQAVWWNGPTVELPKTEGGPDPIAEGATLVALTPGQHLTSVDWCFGCTAITITSITPGNGSLTVAFTTSMPPAGAPGGVSAAAAGDALRTYTVTCTSSTGGVTGSASGPTSPITVTGLTPGATYTCQVAASDGSVTVASSEVSGSVISTTSSSDSDPGTRTVSFPVASASGEMARTGVNSSAQALVGVASLLLGLSFILLTRARRSRAIS